MGLLENTKIVVENSWKGYLNWSCTQTLKILRKEEKKMLKSFFSWLSAQIPNLLLVALAFCFSVPAFLGLWISHESYLFFHLIPIVAIYFTRKANNKDLFTFLLFTLAFSGFLTVNMILTPALVGDAWGMWLPAFVIAVIRFFDWVNNKNQ
jgi:hypothetical protein